MQQYHSNASTNVHIRSEIQNFEGSVTECAQKYNISEATVRKWTERTVLKDRSSKPHNISYALSDIETALIISMRTVAGFSLDDIYDILLEMNEDTSRSSVYRTLKSHGINKKTEEQREKAKKFKEYQPGYLHIDVTYLPKIDGTKYYLFVAIDRATRLLYYKVFDAKTAENTELFVDECIEYFPFKITHILTDNGTEFTNRFYKSKGGKSNAKPSKLDLLCEEENIDHRCTKPFTPKTNGMVERVNGTIKNATILVNTYKEKQEMIDDLNQFLWTYNLFKRHGGLRKELGVRSPIQAVEKWYKLAPDIFWKTPDQLRDDIKKIK